VFCRMWQVRNCARFVPGGTKSTPVMPLSLVFAVALYRCVRLPPPSCDIRCVVALVTNLSQGLWKIADVESIAEAFEHPQKP
jgi:hypothetical protein